MPTQKQIGHGLTQLWYPEALRISGHDTYYAGFGCGYGAFEALIDALRTAVGDPYTSLPGQLMGFAAGGAAGWGTLCGALNGAAAVISLVTQPADYNTLVNELLGWYTQTLFPTDISNEYAINHNYQHNDYDMDLPQNISGSPLCHASVTGWCNTAQFAVNANERKERCARLTGDVAAYTAKILNDHFAGTFVALYVPPETIAECNSCHSASGTVKNVSAKMECTQCHGDDPHGTAVQHVGIPVSTYKLSQNFPNPFNPSTKIRFSIPNRDNVSLTIYDIHGRLVRTVISNTEYNAGTYDATWDGTNDWGEKVASGIYFSKLIAGKFTETKKMSLVK